MKKDKLLREAVEILKHPSFEAWYKRNLEGKNQGDTIKTLLKGLQSKSITEEEALAFSFITGFHWFTYFGGTKNESHS